VLAIWLVVCAACSSSASSSRSTQSRSEMDAVSGRPAVDGPVGEAKPKPEGDPASRNTQPHDGGPPGEAKSNAQGDFASAIAQVTRPPIESQASDTTRRLAIEKLCLRTQVGIGRMSKISSAVETGTDGGGGVAVYRERGKILWALFAVGLSSAYTEVRVCYREDGSVALIDDRIRHYKLDYATGNLNPNVDPIVDPGTRYFYEKRRLLAVLDPREGIEVSASRAPAFLVLAEYLASAKGIAEGWASLPRILGTEK